MIMWNGAKDPYSQPQLVQDWCLVVVVSNTIVDETTIKLHIYLPSQFIITLLLNWQAFSVDMQLRFDVGQFKTLLLSKA